MTTVRKDGASRSTSWLGRSLIRGRGMAGIGVAMMFHDKAKFAAGLVGVVFATVLTTQQAATFLGLLNRNVMLLKKAKADVWVVPPGTQQLQPGKRLAERILFQTRAVVCVEWASPLLYTAGTIDLPNGGSEQVTILGVEPPTMRGGPWYIVRGDPADLSQPDAMFFEDSQRERYGGINLGSLREINGKRVQAIGFTWGLLPFGASFGFASYDKAREIAKVKDRSQNMVLVGVAPGLSPETVAARISREVSGVEAYSISQFEKRTIRWVLMRTPIGLTFGSSAIFGLIVGFVIIAISMFSAVVDRMREFGMLKAIGVTTWDLAKVLFVQSVIFALIGSAIGLTLVGLIVRAIRSPNLALVIPSWFFVVVPALMVFICISASFLALMRLRKVEPGIVFRA